MHHGIGVDEDQDVAARLARPGVARARDLAVRHGHDAGSVRLGHLRRAVGRGIVHHDHLVGLPERARRLVERGERDPEVTLFVVSGNDERDHAVIIGGFPRQRKARAIAPGRGPLAKCPWGRASFWRTLAPVAARSRLDPGRFARASLRIPSHRRALVRRADRHALAAAGRGLADASGRGRHTLIAAPTGTGKTLAAFLWAIDGLLRQGEALRRRDARRSTSRRSRRSATTCRRTSSGPLARARRARARVSRGARARAHRRHAAERARRRCAGARRTSWSPRPSRSTSCSPATAGARCCAPCAR